MNTSGGLHAGYNACALVLNAYEVDSAQGRKKTMDVIIKGADLSGVGCDKIVGVHTAFGLPVRKEVLPPDKATVNGVKQAYPKFFDGATNDMRMLTLCNRAHNISFFPTKEGDRKELPPLPRPGAMVELRGLSVTYGKINRDNVYINATSFTVVSDPPLDTWVGLAGGFVGLRTASLQAASAMAIATTCGGFDLPGLSVPQRFQYLKLEEMAKTEFTRLTSAMESALTANLALHDDDDSSDGRNAEGALSNIKGFMQQLSQDPTPLKTISQSSNHPLLSHLEAPIDKRLGLPVSVVLQGSTPVSPCDSMLASIRDGSEQLPSGAVVAFQYMGHYISPSCKLLRVAFTGWCLGDGEEFLRNMNNDGEMSALRTSQPTIAAKIVNKKISDNFVSNFVHRVKLMVDEIMPYADLAVNVVVKPMPAPNPDATVSQNELEAPFADLFNVDLRGSLERLAPSLSTEEVVKILSNTIVTPSTLGMMPTMPDTPVNPATFSERYVMPLQETGVDLADLDTVAAKLNGSVSYVALWPGCISQAWPQQPDGQQPHQKPQRALPLLEKAAADAGKSVKEFVTEKGVIYAIVTSA